MSILLLSTKHDLQPYKQALLNLDPNLDVEVWPEVKNKKRITFAAAWGQPKDVFRYYPNLKVISSFGAGVEHLVYDETLPEYITITRLVSPSLRHQVADYIETVCYNFIRKMPSYWQQKKKGIWKPLRHLHKKDLVVGIMGLGEIGGFVAKTLAQNRWQVNGWSRSPKSILGIRTFAGRMELTDFLSTSNLIVCQLPLTPETKGILDLDLFKQIGKPAYLINTGRGEHLVEEDLIYALDSGILEGATLDVFTNEPLPETHPFWNRQSIFITPHIASLTEPEVLAEYLAENYKRMLSGMKLKNVVDRDKMY